MALNLREIKKVIIDSVKASIGDQLTQETNPVTLETYGMVLNARPNPEISVPDYPYAIVDLISTQDDDWYLTNHCWNETDQAFEYQTHKLLTFQITIFGGEALGLAEALLTSYRRDDILQILADGGLGFAEAETTTILPELLQTDWLDVGVVKMSVRANDIYSDTSTEIIENVVMDGELYHYDGDPDPLSITVDTTEL